MKTTDTKDTQAAIEAMFEAGAHYGYSRSRRHPSVDPFIYGRKNKLEIIDLEKTLLQLGEALEFVKSLAENGKTLLFVGTKNEAQDIVQRAAESIDMPYVTHRWVGGMFTNFEEIKKRTGRLETLQEQRDRGELKQRYTKKEQLLIDREIEDLEKNFGGIASMKKLPDAIFVVDPAHEEIAVAEARRSNIPVVALANSDCDLGTADYAIVANDSAVPSIAFFVEHVKNTFQMHKKAAPAPEEQKEQQKKEGEEQNKK